MFAFFAPETVKFVEMRTGILTYVSTKKKEPGSSHTVRFALQRPKPNTLDLKNSIISCRQCESKKGFICVAHVLVDQSQFREIESTLSAFALRADLGISARRSPRMPISLRIMSRDLPGYGGVTVDISLHGVRLATPGATPVGTYVRLTVELDVGSLPPQVNVNGKVVWCRGDGTTKTHFLGVEFCDLDHNTVDILTKYNKVLNNRLHGDVMHKTIADGEVFVRKEDPQKLTEQQPAAAQYAPPSGPAQPPAGYGQAPPPGYGQAPPPPGYGNAPPPPSGWTPPPPSPATIPGYGQAPPPPGYGQAPPAPPAGYGQAPTAPPGYGAPTGYGQTAPPPPGYGAPSGYGQGTPPPPGWAPPPPPGYGAPQAPPGYGQAPPPPPNWNPPPGGSPPPPPPGYRQ